MKPISNFLFFLTIVLISGNFLEITAGREKNAIETYQIADYTSEAESSVFIDEGTIRERLLTEMENDTSLGGDYRKLIIRHINERPHQEPVLEVWGEMLQRQEQFKENKRNKNSCILF